MKRKIPVLLVLSILVSAANAEGFDSVGKVSLGQKSITLDIVDRSFSPTFNTVNLALTSVRKKLYITLEHEFSLKDPIETDPNGLIFYTRTDTSLTVGYSLRDSLSLFGGYRSGETDAKYTANNGDFGNSSEGYYLGGSYSYYSKKLGGSFGLSLAVAGLDGEVSLSEPFVDTVRFRDGVGASPPQNIEGSAVGFSLGLSWTAEISKDTLYTLAAKLQRYEFEDDIVFGGLDLTYNEDSNTISLGITHFF